MPDLRYSADDIQTVVNLEHVRYRPNAYVGDRGVGGQIHTIWEILSNSVDELVLKPEGGAIWIGILCDYVHQRYQVFVRDTGRGIPAAKLESTTAVIGTSGKMDSGAYLASGGQFGIGAKVAAALSTRYRIISHNYLEDVVGDLSLENGKITDHHDETLSTPSGVTTVVELDVDTFFNGGSEFISTGYLDLVNICRKLNIFNENLNFQFYLYERTLPETFWKGTTREAVETIDRFITSVPKQVVYAADQVVDKAAYLTEIWRMTSNIIYRTAFSKNPVDADDRLGFDVKVFFTKRSATGNPQYFITVNNVELPDKTENSATVTFNKVLTQRVANELSEDHLKQFVTNEYRFPTMCLALGVRYNRADLSGVTKTSFKDTIFAAQFEKELNQIFDGFQDGYWKHFVEMIKPDIESRYAQFYDAPISKSEGRRVFVDLNFSENYKECKGTDHDELYIVEGQSAGGITTMRDPEFQAVYTTRGKPVNVATSADQIDENRKKLLKDPIYQDLIKVLNINPRSTDMNSARFKKIIIATDADPDGYHIASLHINNLYILNPRIIESGMVWWANPPLYSMNISRSNRLFLRDELAYHEALLNFIYRPALDIAVELPDSSLIHPTPELEREIYYLIDVVGEKFQQVATQLNIPVMILERLVMAINDIYPNVNYDKLSQYFVSSDAPGYIRLQAFPEKEYVVISIGSEDYPIALNATGRAIVDHLLSDVIKYKICEFNFRVTSKLTGGMLKNTPMTVMTFYSCLLALRDKFKVTRYKGLGKMPNDSCYATIMNPETRSMTQITSVGDWLQNYRLLGKDTSERKHLLTETNTLSMMFARQNSTFQGI